ncbi:dsba oxidoreductase [Luminiphilus syltensis NOR5-1B]|uniref:Thiol:disulfide interchange protein n=1 Tax=Luminiphilus syltensis NOR5-1B TaxID=565045 RepID=B8KUJ8_9GAMM|nr:thiol:disulfide interchange protein DsbA/DsbL [Luminiphilus syltensis]EED35896.1 dsba oxidoreductase [Luminiphilus syltensis NOR5-1B]
MGQVFKAFSVAAMLTLISFSFGVSAAEWKEGEHYDVLKPGFRAGASDTIVVTEFFSYGCPHCFTFEPMLTAWSKTLPEGVELQPSPVIFNASMQLHAKAFYAAEVLGVVDTVHPALFKAIHVQRQRLASKDEIRGIFVANGVDGEEFDNVIDSFGVSSQVRQSDARVRASQISGTPSIVVNGKYRVSARKAGSQANMLKLADHLIAMEQGQIE